MRHEAGRTNFLTQLPLDQARERLPGLRIGATRVGLIVHQDARQPDEGVGPARAYPHFSAVRVRLAG